MLYFSATMRNLFTVTEFALCLTAAVTTTGESLREVARTCDVDSSLLSRLCAGTAGPSGTALKALCSHLNPEVFPKLGSDFGPQLQLAYLRDCAADIGVDLALLRISFAETADATWWESLDPVLAARLRHLGIAATEDKEFAAILTDLEPLSLKLRGALRDAADLKKIREANVYPFPKSKDLMVAESKASSRRGKSQEPTA
jgi:transcriptional regulator with XRE-family HTH domain